MLYESYDPAWGPATLPQYNQYPYILITTSDGMQFQGRATAWTRDKVRATWVDPEAPPRKVAWTTTQVQRAWMDAHHARPISRREAAKKDPYDDYGHFRSLGEL